MGTLSVRSFLRKFGCIVLACWVLFGMVWSGALGAVDRDSKIIIMVSDIDSIANLPAKLTEALGYFKDEGLNVELQEQPVGVDAEDLLLSGAVQAVVGFYDHTIDLQSKGKNIEAIVVLNKTPGEMLLVSTRAASHFKSMADARGQILGVAGLGSSSEFLTRYLAERAGVPANDYALLPMGQGDAFVTAMRHGRIQAGMFTEPAAYELLASGDARVLVDLRTNQGQLQALGGPYPAASVCVQNTWANTHRVEATKLAHAFARTLRYINTHSAEDIANKMPPGFYDNDRAHYVRALWASLPMFTTDGKMPVGGPETVLKVLNAYRPQVKSGNIDLSKTYTNAFLTTNAGWARSGSSRPCRFGDAC